jgi:hypothetical protein
MALLPRADAAKVDLETKKESPAMPRGHISPAMANEVSAVPSDRLTGIVYFGLKDRSHAVGVTTRSKLIMERAPEKRQGRERRETSVERLFLN